MSSNRGRSRGIATGSQFPLGARRSPYFRKPHAVFETRLQYKQCHRIFLSTKAQGVPGASVKLRGFLRTLESISLTFKKNYSCKDSFLHCELLRKQFFKCSFELLFNLQKIKGGGGVGRNHYLSLQQTFS